MQFRLFNITGYSEAIMSLQMSRGKYTWEKAKALNELIHAVTDEHGFISSIKEYGDKLCALGIIDEFGIINKTHSKISGEYEKDVDEFKRLLNIVMDNAMGHHEHHTLMKYIDLSFFTEKLHRGAQDDLDAHAMAFDNRITRFSTRLAVIEDVELSEFYQGKVIPFHKAINMIDVENFRKATYELADKNMIGYDCGKVVPPTMPPEIVDQATGGTFKYTPFGYVLDKYADQSPESMTRKDVLRGLMNLGMPSNAIWKINLPNLRYVYKMRGELTKANPELKKGIELLADQVEAWLPVFGEHIRDVFTSSHKWERVQRVKTITNDEWKEYQAFKRMQGAKKEAK